MQKMYASMLQMAEEFECMKNKIAEVDSMVIEVSSKMAEVCNKVDGDHHMLVNICINMKNALDGNHGK